MVADGLTVEELSAELERLVRSVPDALWSAERDGDGPAEGTWRYRYVSPVLAAIAGREPDALGESPSRWWDLAHPEDRPGIASRVRAFLASGQTDCELEYRILRPDGSVRWVSDRMAASRDADGRAVRLSGIVRDVTERRQAVEGLQEREGRLSRVVETITEGILLIDRNSRITLANTAAERMFRRPRSRLSAQCWYELPWEAKSRDDAPQPGDKEILARVLQEGQAVRGQERLIEQPLTPGAPAGRLIVSTSFAPLHDALGKVMGMVISFTDITERTEFEERLRRGEERFRALVAKSSDGILLTDADGRIVYASSSSLQLLGYDAASLRGTSVLDLIHPEDRERLGGRTREILARPGEAVTEQFRCLRRDGAERFLEVVVCNRLGEESVQAVVINYRDITERHQAEQALGRQHALLSGLINSVPDLIFYKDRSGRYLGCNAAYESYARRPAAELARRRDGEPGAEVPPAFWRDAEREVLATQRPQRREGWIEAADGRRVLVEMLLTPLVDAGGQLLGLIGIGRDLTERKRLEEHLRQTGKIEAIGQLAGGVAHDFNNLLTVILANSALVLKGAPPAVAGPLRAIEQAATKAAELTAKLLGFARRSAIHLEPLALNDVVRETAELLRRTIDPRIDLDLRLAGDLWAVEADRSMVSQVLMNLCLNARDAMPEGGRLTVETSNLSLDETATGSNLDARPGEFTRLRVRDTGCGIPPEVRARIFEPFFTTKDVGKGTGMGLAMVYGIVRMHNGWIEVESDVGSGTEFDVYLPRSRRTPVAPPEPPPPPTGGRETVLLVDDEPMIRDLGVAILERFGYRVLLACDGREAIDIYRDRGREIDLVVLDLTMPNLSGRDASRELRRIDPGVRILFTSGYSADYLDDSSELPALGFVSKPYRPDELAAAVRAALDRAPASPDG